MKYTVSALEPKHHMLDVELHLDDVGTEPVRIAFPAWVPGHYFIEDFAGFVRGETATGDGGKRLPLSKVDKATFEIRPGKSRTLKFKFQTWAYRVSVHRSFLDDERMSINGGNCFPWVVGRDTEPATIQFLLPDGWDGPYTGMEPVPGQTATFRVDNYDDLLDCPIFAGKPHVETFDIRGVPHHLVMAGRCNAPIQRLTRDVEKMSRTTAALFGKIPYKHYHYLVDLAEARGGGLEHKNSTHIVLGRWQFHPRSAYVDSMALFAHEFFHTWNVKRMRPARLGPFDYTKETYTSLLWFAEGVTSYYEKIMLRRSGVISNREFLDLLGREIQRLQLVPGRNYHTLERSSEETWIKLYRRGPQSDNSQVSYYNKGSLVGFLLDMEMRLMTGNKRSLDDLMKRMYKRYYVQEDRGFEAGELEEEAATLVGKSMKPFFDKYLRSTQELDFARALGAAGLERVSLEARIPPPGELEPRDSLAPISYLGIGLKVGRSLVIDNVLDDGPGCEGGMAPGDEILAIDRMRMTPGRVAGLLAELSPGTPIQVMVDRMGEIRELDIVTGKRPAISTSIRPSARASELQKKTCKSWMKTNWKDIDRTSPAVQQRERFRVG